MNAPTNPQEPDTRAIGEELFGVFDGMTGARIAPGLLDLLKDGGLSIGPRERVATASLVAALLTQNPTPTTLADLRPVLVPLLARSPAERETFFRIFDGFAPSNLPAHGAAPLPIAPTPRSRGRTQWFAGQLRGRTLLLAVLLLAAVAGLTAYLSMRPGPVTVHHAARKPIAGRPNKANAILTGLPSGDLFGQSPGGKAASTDDPATVVMKRVLSAGRSYAGAPTLEELSRELARTSSVKLSAQQYADRLQLLTGLPRHTPILLKPGPREGSADGKQPNAAGLLGLALNDIESPDRLIPPSAFAKAVQDTDDDTILPPSPNPGRSPTTNAMLARLAKEHRCLAEAMYYEARAEGEAGQEAVAEVVLNRLATGKHGNSICAVVNEGAGDNACQFSFTCDGARDAPKQPDQWASAQYLAARILSGATPLENTTGGAVNFHASNVDPGWTKPAPTARIGNHVFYRRRPRTVTIDGTPVSPASLTPPVANEIPAAGVVPFSADNVTAVLTTALENGDAPNSLWDVKTAGPFRVRDIFPPDTVARALAASPLVAWAFAEGPCLADAIYFASLEKPSALETDIESVQRYEASRAAFVAYARFAGEQYPRSLCALVHQTWMDSNGSKKCLYDFACDKSAARPRASNLWRQAKRAAAILILNSDSAERKQAAQRIADQLRDSESELTSGALLKDPLAAIVRADLRNGQFRSGLTLLAQKGVSEFAPDSATLLKSLNITPSWIDPTPPRDARHAPPWSPWAVTLFPLALMLFWLFNSIVLRKAFLRRRTPEFPPLHMDLVAETVRGLSPMSVLFHRIGSRLQRRTAQPSDRPDIQATVDASIREGGIFIVPRFEQTRAAAEYLVLIEKHSEADQNYEYLRTLVNRLDGLVALDVFSYQNEPSMLQPEGGGRAVPIERLAAAYPHHRLLVLGSGAGFLDHRLHKPLPSATTLTSWPRRALLTPVPLSEWTQEEFTLARELSLPIGRATPEGLLSLAEMLRLEGLEDDELLDGSSDGLARPLPDLLRVRPQRYLYNSAPEDHPVEQIIQDLRNYLDGPGFEWLCTLGVYPAVQWDLTLYLGATLAEKPGGDSLREPLYREDRVAALTQLPWLREGRFPPWLRRALIDAIGEKRAREVRRALQKLLEDAQPTGDAALDQTIRIRIGREAAKERTAPGELFEDEVLLDFMAKGEIEDLEFSNRDVLARFLPDALVRRVGRPEIATAIVGLAYAAAAYWLAPSPSHGALIGSAWTPLVVLVAGGLAVWAAISYRRLYRVMRRALVWLAPAGLASSEILLLGSAGLVALGAVQASAAPASYTVIWPVAYAVTLLSSLTGYAAADRFGIPIRAPGGIMEAIYRYVLRPAAGAALACGLLVAAYVATGDRSGTVMPLAAGIAFAAGVVLFALGAALVRWTPESLAPPRGPLAALLGRGAVVSFAALMLAPILPAGLLEWHLHASRTVLPAIEGAVHPAESDILAASPDGRYFATGSASGIVRVYDASNAAVPLSTIDVGRTPPTELVLRRLTKGSLRIAVASFGSSVKIYDAQTGKLFKDTKIASAGVAPHVALAADGGWAVTYERDDGIFSVDTDQGVSCSLASAAKLPLPTALKIGRRFGCLEANGPSSAQLHQTGMQARPFIAIASDGTEAKNYVSATLDGTMIVFATASRKRSTDHGSSVAADSGPELGSPTATSIVAKALTVNDASGQWTAVGVDGEVVTGTVGPDGIRDLKTSTPAKQFATERETPWRLPDVSSIGRWIDFGIASIHLAGNVHTPAEQIIAALGLAPGQPILRLDIASAQARLEKLPWVADARIRRVFPNEVSVAIVEKQPFALWRAPDDNIWVVARNGELITTGNVDGFKNLPILVGEGGANGADIIDAVRKIRSVNARIRAYQRIAERRWNLILDNGVVVELPEQNWQQQLYALDHLIVDKGILKLDVAEIDLRAPSQYFFVLKDGSTKPERRERANWPGANR